MKAVYFFFILAYCANVVQSLHGGASVSLLTQYPYHVSIRESNGAFICSGCMIGYRWVLTAAHCVDLPNQPTHVRIKTLNRNSGGQSTPIVNIIIHEDYMPQFRPPVYDHDIALVETLPLVFTANLQPLLIPHFDIMPGDSLIATGWGTYWDTWPPPNQPLLPSILRYLKTSTIDIATCMAAFPSGIIYSGNLCTQHSGMKALCKDDDGGPLVKNNYVHGIMIWNENGCIPGSIDVSINVYKYIDWLYLNMVP